MFDKRLALTGAAVTLVAALSFLLSTSADTPPEASPMAETVSGVERRERQEPPAPPEEPGYAYMLKEHEGRVAVYAAGNDEPEMILDVLVKYLPDYDRSQMEQGIPVRDYSHLVSLIEDYTS